LVLVPVLSENNSASCSLKKVSDSSSSDFGFESLFVLIQFWFQSQFQTENGTQNPVPGLVLEKKEKVQLRRRD
jgi:hypothetical protein